MADRDASGGERRIPSAVGFHDLFCLFYEREARLGVPRMVHPAFESRLEALTAQTAVMNMILPHEPHVPAVSGASVVFLGGCVGSGH